MHELSIAESIVRVAVRHAAGRRVYAVEVKVGHLRQVVPSALDFAFELVAQDTPLEGAELRIEEVAAVGRCRACGVESRLDGFPLRCSACGGLDLEVVRGEELLVDSLELEDGSARTRPSRALAAEGSARTRPSRALAADGSARTRPSRALAAESLGSTGGMVYGD